MPHRGWAAALLVAATLVASPTNATVEASGAPSDPRPTFEALFDGWTESPLATEQVLGTDVLPEIDSQSRDLLERIAFETGRSDVDAFVDANWLGNDFNVLVQKLESSYPKIFTSASRANPEVTSSDYDLVFTVRPPQVVFDELSRLAVDTDVRYGAPFSRVELRQLEDKLRNTMRVGSAPIAVESSPLGTAIRVLYDESVGATLFGSQAKAALQVRKSVDPLIASFDPSRRLLVQVDGQAGLASERLFVEGKGGFALASCTSGFAAKIGGTRGLLTARHCPDRPRYMGSTEMGLAVNSSSSDIQFNSMPSPHTVAPRFRVSQGGTLFTVSGVANPVYGDYVEKYGVTTQRTWGYVIDADTCNTASGYCNLFKVNMDGYDGDSGGPCFNGGNARGLVQGGDPGNYTYCSKISASPATVLQGG